MTTPAVLQTIDHTDLKVGTAYMVVRHTNALGQPMTPIRKGDWRAVLLTTENLARYTDGSYWIQPVKDSNAARLIAAGWTKFSRSQGQCGAEIVTKGKLFGLACERPAMWGKGGGHPACVQHAIIEQDAN